MIDLKANPFFLDDEAVRWVEETKAQMTTDEKLEQLFFPIGYSSNEGYLQYELLNRHPGGVMFSTGKTEELFSAYSYLQNNTKIPLFLAANLEAGGDGIVEEGTAFGKQMQCAATGDPGQAYRLGKIACAEGQAVGCNYAFAPVVDIGLNYHNPITNVRTYGSDVDMVKACGLAYMKGAKECGSAVSIKHFPGDGVDETDQHILTSVNSLSCEAWDTDEYHYRAWKTMADGMGIYFDRTINNRLRGVSRMESLEIVLERYDGPALSQADKARLATQKNDIYRESLHEMSPADLSDEVKQTLDGLRALGLKLAIGSSSKNTPFILGQLGLAGYFDAVSDGNNITRSKPDPEVFVKAAEMLGIAPERCLVVEDTVSGAEAGHTGGMKVACLGDAAKHGAGDWNMESIPELMEIVKE